MTAGDLVLVISWVVCGIGGGWATGSELASEHRNWWVVAVGAIAMVFGIACGIAVMK